jgi:hypothetical protein
MRSARALHPHRAPRSGRRQSPSRCHSAGYIHYLHLRRGPRTDGVPGPRRPRSRSGRIAPELLAHERAPVRRRAGPTENMGHNRSGSPASPQPRAGLSKRTPPLTRVRVSARSGARHGAERRAHEGAVASAARRAPAGLIAAAGSEGPGVDANALARTSARDSYSGLAPDAADFRAGHGAAAVHVHRPRRAGGADAAAAVVGAALGVLLACLTGALPGVGACLPPTESEGSRSRGTGRAAQRLPPGSGLAEAAYKTIKPLRIHARTLHHDAPTGTPCPRPTEKLRSAGSARSAITAQAIRSNVRAGWITVRGRRSTGHRQRMSNHRRGVDARRYAPLPAGSGGRPRVDRGGQG